ncbi:MAG TPA: hypothetical protein VH835_05695 [Dongiaceae bacterium]|jgi:hypothetical protein
MARPRNPRKREAESLFQFRIDVPVPEGGLGSRLNEMLDWCRANVESGQWAQHGHVQKQRGRIALDYARFYFALEADADLFWWRWCLPQ